MHLHYKTTILIVCLALSLSKQLHAQFPGYYVQHFNSENGLQNTIKAMISDSAGFIWMATESGLARYDGFNFRMFDHSDSGKPVSRLIEIGLTRDGKVYVQTDQKEYYKITPKNLLRRTTVDEIRNQTASHQLSVATRAVVYNQHRKKILQKQLPSWALPGTKTNRSPIVTNIVLSGGHYLFLNTDNELIASDTSLQDPCKLSTSGLPGKDRKEPTLKDHTISLLQNGNDIYLKYGEYIYQVLFDIEKKHAQFVQVLYIGNISSIIGIVQNPNLNLYVAGTEADGIYVLRKEEFSLLIENFNTVNVIYAQSPFRNNGVITKNGIYYPHKYEPFPFNISQASILRTNDGFYYVHRLETNSGTITKLDSNLKIVNEIPSGGYAIKCFKQFSDGSIWIGQDSIFIGRIKNDAIESFERPSELPATASINDLLEAGNNEIWIATDQGLGKFNLSTSGFQFIPELKNTNVRTLFKDTRGTIWIGTYGKGFFALYKNRLVPIPPDLHRYLEYAHHFMIDNMDRLWISTNRGLFLFSMHDLYQFLEQGGLKPFYFYYDNSSGFLTNEFNGGCQPSGIALNNGYYSLPSLKGLVQFKPENIIPKAPDAEIFIDRVYADTTEYPVIDSLLTLSKNARNLQLFISSPYFGNAYNQRIEYKISNDNIWYTLGKDHLITINNLKAGEHKIELRKQAGFGAGNYITKTFSFKVEPQFYQTTWFLIIAGMLCLLILFLVYRVRLNLLIRQKKKLEAEVNEKTKEQLLLIGQLETIVTELEASKLDLKKTIHFKEKLAMIITHDLQSPLRFLSMAVERLNNLNAAGTDEMQELSSEVRKTTSSIYRFVENFSVWIKKVNIKGKLDINPVNLNELTADLAEFFSHIQLVRQNQIQINVPASTFVWSDYQVFRIILHNILDNAMKHTFDGSISIELIDEGETISLEVSDTGEGIKPELNKKLDNYIQTDRSLQSDDFVEGLGFGFRFITDFCKLLDYKLSIKSEIALGTTIRISNIKKVTTDRSLPVQPAQIDYHGI